MLILTDKTSLEAQLDIDTTVLTYSSQLVAVSRQRTPLHNPGGERHTVYPHFEGHWP